MSASVAAVLIILSRFAVPPPERGLDLTRSPVTYATVMAAAKAIEHTGKPLQDKLI